MTSSSKKPNLLIFVADQWRGDVLGHLGNPAACTPHLDDLVESHAVSFSQAFCQNPVCTPSRCSFMTGLYPHTRGHRSMNFPLQADEPNLLQQLKRQGYYVWWGGKNDLVTDEEGFAAACDYRHQASVRHSNLHENQSWRQTDHGKPDYSFFAGRLETEVDEEIYLDSDWSHVLAAEKFIREYESEQPFCIFLALQYPHPPYGVEEPFFRSIDRTLLPKRIKASEQANGKPRMHSVLRDEINLRHRTEQWWDELRATYYGMCARVDTQAGRLIEAFKARGIFDDAGMFFLSDHGDFTGDYGLVEKAQNLFEDCIVKVPFIFKPPVTTGQANGVRQGLIELIDFPATVYELAGVEPDYTHFGRSLVPLLHEDGEHRDAVFSYGGRLEHEIHAATENDGALDPNGLYYPRLRIQKRDHVAHGKAVMCRNKCFKLISRLYEPDELYDLQMDPDEKVNRIDDPALAKDREALYARLRRFFMETIDVIPWTAYPRDVPSAPAERLTGPPKDRESARPAAVAMETV